MAVFKLNEWAGAGGRYHCAQLGTQWWAIARVLGISPAELINVLVKDYKARIDYYSEEKDLLLFSWAEKDYSIFHKFTLWVNRVARNKGIQVKTNE